jgi:hypothetical protein
VSDAAIDLSPEQAVRWWRDRGERELCQVLYWCWDPIGVNDAFPYTEGEYDRYAPRIFAALNKRSSARDIGALLASIENVEMGLSHRIDKDAAQRIVDWYGNSRRHWLAFDQDPPGRRGHPT